MRGGCVIGGSQTPADQHVPNRRTHSVRHGALRLASGTHFTSRETHQETSKGIPGLSFGISSAELVSRFPVLWISAALRAKPSNVHLYVS